MGARNAEDRVDVVQHRMLGEDRVDSNTQTLMAGEDFAFIAKCADLSAYCVFETFTHNNCHIVTCRFHFESCD